MLLVANGCSHTAGAELEWATQGDCYEKAWPKHLSDSLGYSHINLSMAGASNARVLRTTYEFIYDYKKQGKDFKQLLFVILWPGLHRTEVYCDKDYLHAHDNNWTPIVVGNDACYKEFFSHSLYHYYKAWSVISTPYQSSCDFYQTTLNLQNLFNRYNIKYLFMDSTRRTTIKELSYYTAHIDRKYYEGFDEISNCYATLCSENGQKISKYSVDSGFNSHYDEDAHIWFAQHVNCILHKRNIL